MGIPLGGPVQIMRCHKSGDVPAALFSGQICINEFDGILFFPDANTAANGSGQYTTIVAIALKALVAALTAVRGLAMGGTGVSATSAADLLAKIGAAALAGAAFTGAVTVPDTALGDSSSSAANTRFVSNAIAALVNGAPAALDTLKEISDKLAADDGALSSLVTAVGVRVQRAGDQMTGALDLAPAVTVASAATTPIGAAPTNFVAISGTTAITAFDIVPESVYRFVRFAAAGLVLTYNATSLILPGAANITTQAGDHAIFRSLGSGNWRCISYQRADGSPLAVNAQTPGLATVATSGSYNDLTNKPAASAFPVSSIVAKSTAYPIVVADKGTMFDLTGSFALTLPAVSGASASAPLYHHFTKRDGSGKCTLAPSGSDTFAGGSTLASIYQEQFTVVSFGGPWYFIGRQRGPVNIQSTTVLTSQSLSSLSITAGFLDPEISELEIPFTNLSLGPGSRPLAQVQKNGTLQTGSTYNVEAIDVSSGTVSGTSTTSTSCGVTPTGNTNGPLAGVINIKNTLTAVATDQRVDIYSMMSGLTRRASFIETSNYQLQNLVITPGSGGKLTAITYSVRGFRP